MSGEARQTDAMTPRQRVRTTLLRGQADRVPVNYSANPDIDRRLKEHFGLDPEDGEGLRRALGVDFRFCAAPYVGPRLHQQSEEPNLRISPDWGLRTRYIRHASGGYWEPVPGHLRDLDEQQAKSYPMPSPDDYDYEAVPRHCARMGEFAVATHPGFEVMSWTARHLGHEEMYVRLATGDPAILTFIRRFTEIRFEVLRRTLDAAGGRIDFLIIGEDLGTQRGPRISAQMFRERIRPIHQPFIDLAKSHDLPVMIHSCGSSSWAFEDFIEMGIDAVDTLQPEAADMAPAYLKERFGGRLAFHGCISTAGPLATGTPEETVQYCRRTLEIMMPGGGYCFAPTHMIQDNTPTENAVAMYETAQKSGAYESAESTN